METSSVLNIDIPLCRDQVLENVPKDWERKWDLTGRESLEGAAISLEKLAHIAHGRATNLWVKDLSGLKHEKTFGQ